MSLLDKIIKELQENNINHNSIKAEMPWTDRIKIINKISNLSDKKRFYKRVEATKDIAKLNYYKYCVKHVAKDIALSGIWVEMGVHEGRTINILNRFKEEIFPSSSQVIHGFDSFKGLPEAWKPGFGKGRFATSVPELKRCQLHVGWFKDTLPDFAEANKDKKIALLHVDCDLYSSTKETFKHLGPLVTKGTVILLDEIIGDSHHVNHEYKAFMEFVKEYKIELEWIAYVANGAQAACIVKNIGVNDD